MTGGLHGWSQSSEQSNANRPAGGNGVKVLRFDVVSVKPVIGDPGRWRMQNTPDGYTASNVSLRMLFQDAYGIYEDYRITGAPSWFETEKYDLEAKVAEQDIPALRQTNRAEIMQMLQAVLAERFHLKIHMESKDLPIYALVVAKGGPKLAESKPVPDGSSKGAHVIHGAPHWEVERGTMETLTRLLTPRLGRTVVDQTGLTGRYDFKLDWSPDMRTATDDASSNGAQPGLLPAAPSGPSIFTAVQEQLGLKLEPQKGPVEILVIDHAGRPSAN